MNKNPIRPEEMNEIMTEVFGVKKKRIFSKQKQIAREISEMIEENIL